MKSSYKIHTIFTKLTVGILHCELPTINQIVWLHPYNENLFLFNVVQGFSSIACLLLDAEADVNAKQSNSGETALIKVRIFSSDFKLALLFPPPLTVQYSVWNAVNN